MEAPAVDGRSTRWAEHRRARRAALVDAALRAVRARGAAVTMDDVAAEAGTSKPVLYRWFDDKADLYLAVGRAAAAKVVDRVTEVLAGPGEDPREHLSRIVDAYLAEIESEPALYRVLVARSFAGPAPGAVTDHAAMVSVRVADYLAQRLAELGLDPAAAQPWARGLVGFVSAVGDWWLEHPGVPRAEVADRVTALLWSGLGGVTAGASTAGQPR